MRSSGVLMHVSSLHGDYSVGSFGKEAKEWIDTLVSGGFSYWQVLPFCMVDECNSPYKSYSAFGGNPYFIDLPTLKEKGYISESDLKRAKQKDKYLCEFERLLSERVDLLQKASVKFKENKQEYNKMLDFLREYPDLADAAKFMALKSANGDLPWTKWTTDEVDEEDLLCWQFIEYEFFTEWQEIKAYANERGVKIIGDIPIYVAFDSCDVWANKSQFLLDEENKPSCVAGVPPDYFSEDGQLWGNPLYDWEKMEKDGFDWWQRRIKYMLTLFDGVRIDHFRGLESYWSIPADSTTAKAGKWVKGPGEKLVDKLREIAADKLIIAEDLGDITPEVNALLRYSGFPGMRVFQFAFLGDTNAPHLPHNYDKNCIAYTGTHDNNTLLGHVWEMSESDRARAFEYCNYSGNDWSQACEYIIKTMLESHADTVILPVQDLLVYGADTRMNTPGKAENNWRYRITKEQLDSIDMKKYKKLNELYSR
ncbi:MAG: 4-alpha-glucanotransferase [Clostridia bacterium]|nr:4-alpha-glucanotransferase [Clostridia bacterium]